MPGHVGSLKAVIACDLPAQVLMAGVLAAMMRRQGLIARCRKEPYLGVAKVTNFEEGPDAVPTIMVQQKVFQLQVPVCNPLRAYSLP